MTEKVIIKNKTLVFTLEATAAVLATIVLIGTSYTGASIALKMANANGMHHV